MKKLFLLSVLLVISLLAKAQAPFSLSEGESALVYSLPKTVFCIEVQTEKTTQKPGKFYRYSERYLATNKVITEEKTTYKLKNIVVKTRAIADPNRTYSIAPNGNLQTSRLSVNAQGILCGINTPAEPETAPAKVCDAPKTETSNQDALLPLGEEYMMAGSEAKLAEGAAKQIYRIRESRMGLLTADIDKLPADGESLKSMLEGMNKLEKKLTELFIGQTNTEIETQTLYLTPTASVNNEVLFRLSGLKGLVASDDLSGVPYYISVTPAEKATAGPKSKSENGALYTVLPVSTQLSISDGVSTIYSNQFFVPQFGKTISLPESLFKQAHLKVRVDQQTGRLLGIE
ncbi:MAG TPA: DUF4831 family protein [Paludibacter sp.]|nr:DUF4831 family protein [Paludibacter sp.]